MADLNQFIQEIRNKDPHLGLQLQTMVDAIQSVAQGGGLGVLQKLPAPATLAAVNVAWNKAGVYQITHQTSQPPNIGAHYFSEIDTSPSFPAPIVIDHGVSRSTEPKVLPNGTYYFRGYHQYPGSLPSEPVNYGGETPAPVVIAGGSDLTLLPSTGSGTSPENGQRGGTGFGIDQTQPPNSQLTLASIPSSGGGGGGGGGTSFAVITSGDNTQADMTVDTGASLSYAGTGVVDANEIGGINVDGNTPSHEGQLLISQPGNTTAVWADPLVQGVSPVGTATSGINPVLVGAEDNSGNLANLNLDSSGNLKVVASGGGASNPAAGPTGSAVPADASYTGYADGSGNLVGISASAPLPAADASDMSGTVPGTAPGSTGIVGGIYNSSAPSPTTGQTLPVQLDSSGNLKVNVAAGSSGNAAASATGSAVPADAGYTGFNSGGNLVGVSSTNPLPSTDKADGTVGSATPSTAITIGGTDGTDLRAVLTNVEGSLLTAPASTIVDDNITTSVGVDWTVTVTAGQRWQITSIQAAFACNATVANRQTFLEILNASGKLIYLVTQGTVLVASQTGEFTWFPGAQFYQVPFSSNSTFIQVVQPLPSPCILGPGTIIRTLTQTIQTGAGGDQWTGPNITYQKFSDT